MTTVSALIPQLKMLASYQGWANTLLMQHLATTSEEHYRKDCGLFFRSIHGTLNHMLLGDRIWYGRFSDQLESFSDLGQEIEAGRGLLAAALVERHGLWTTLIANTSDDVMAGTLHYRTTSGKNAAVPWAGALLHVFNHATHHRGQISAALTGFGYACPELDLIHFLLTDNDVFAP